jgi:hypothetical protein
MISGNSVILQVGKETAYGTPGTMQRQIKFSSEGFQPAYNKVQEPVMTGGIGAGRFETMGIRAEGSASFLARPDDVGMFLKYALGLETKEVIGTGTPPAVRHTFKALGNGLNDSLPSLTFMLDKKTSVFVYPGCKINSLSFSAAPEDFLNVELELTGKTEQSGGSLASLVPSLLKSFKFNQGKVYLAGTEIADITNIGFNYNNNLESTIQTTSTGLYYKEPQPNTRELSVDLEMLYSAQAEQFRQDWFKSDNILAVKLEFTSDEVAEAGTDGDPDIPYSLSIELPACQVTECSNAVGSAEGIRQSATLTGIDNPGGDLIIAKLVNKLNELY